MQTRDEVKGVHNCREFSQPLDATNFYTGRLRPEVQPLTLLYTIFYEDDTPFVYLLLKIGTYPFNWNQS